MAVNKHLQLLRKTTPYASLNAAMTAMNAATAPKEGEPFLAYYSGGTSNELSALLAIPGPNGTPKLYFLDNKEVGRLIDAAKTELIGGASTSADTLGELEELINNIKDNTATYAIQEITSSLPEDVKKRYQLTKTVGSTTTKEGDFIDIYKDSHIVSINYIKNPSDPHYQNMEYVYLDASGETKTTYIDMSELVLEAEFASGVTVTNHVVRGVVDPTSETFLTVDANGFKLSGVQDAIDAAVEDLDAVASGSTTHVSVKVTEADGEITAVDVTEDDIASNTDLTNEIGYRKAVTGVNGNAYTADTTTNYISGATSLFNADKLLDAQAKANTDAIAAEVAARKNITGNDADTYVAPSSSNYLSSSTSLKNAAVLLDAQVKANADAIDALEGAKVSVSASTETESAKYLSVSVNGDETVYTVQVSGIDAAIITAIEALDAPDTAVTDQFVTSVSEADGVITVERATPHASGITATAMSSGATQVAVTGTTVANQIKSLAETAKTIMDNAYSGVTAGDGIEVTPQTNGDTVAIKLTTTGVTADLLSFNSTTHSLEFSDTFDCGEW